MSIITEGQGTLPLNPLSRYKNTRLYSDSDIGKTYFGVWRAPEIVERRSPTLYKVRPDEPHRPDLISYRVYGNVTLFWAIAVRNAILLPMKDITTGMTLVCPHIEDVLAAMAESNTLNPGTF